MKGLKVESYPPVGSVVFVGRIPPVSRVGVSSYKKSPKSTPMSRPGALPKKESVLPSFNSLELVLSHCITGQVNVIRLLGPVKGVSSIELIPVEEGVACA